MGREALLGEATTGEFVLESSLRIDAAIDHVWQCVTDVDLTTYPHPSIFRLLGVPRPLRAELEGGGVGACRTAWFDNGKRFRQVVSEWRPPSSLRFSFTADPGFRAGYLFDLSAGPFRILEGWYHLEALQATATRATLGSRYRCSIPRMLLAPWGIRRVLAAYQRLLLRKIGANCAGGAR